MGVSANYFSAKYCIFSALTVCLFETDITWSPATDRIFIYRVVNLCQTYFDLGFVGNLLCFQFIQLVVLIVIKRVVDAGNWDPVVDACLVNCRRQAVLRQLQFRSFNQSHSSRLVLQTGSMQQLPNLFSPRGPCLYTTEFIVCLAYPKTPLSIFRAAIYSRASHTQKSF